MPVYEYRCRSCQQDFERYLPSAATTVACPDCASGDVMRKLSVFGMKTDSPVASTMSAGGGCCGGGCSCH